MTKLPTSDYKLLEVDGREYVFLTGSQEIMEITNPLLTAYFNPTCESEAKGTNEETFEELTSALIVKRDAVHIREDPDRNPRQVMLTLNTTHRCIWHAAIALLLPSTNRLSLCLSILLRRR